MTEKILERLKALTHDNPMVTDNYILRKDAIEIVQEVAREYDWIPTEKAFPTENERVLCLTNRGRMETAIYRQGGFLACGSTWLKKVIAWQPLPAPYRKGE